MLKIMQFSVLMQILFNIFVKDFANAAEYAFLMYNNMLGGDHKHFEGHD